MFMESNLDEEVTALNRESKRDRLFSFFAAMDSSEFFSAWKQKIKNTYRIRRTWKTNRESLHFQAFEHRDHVDETLTIGSARIGGAHRYTIESAHWIEP